MKKRKLGELLGGTMILGKDHTIQKEQRHCL